MGPSVADGVRFQLPPTIAVNMDTDEWVEYILNDPHASKALKALGVAVSAVALYKLAGYILRELMLVPKLTILRDVEDLHKLRKGGKIPGRVIICGGSVGGMLAAAVCADHFDSVLIVESEAWANEHGSEIPEKREYRTTSDGYQAIVPPRTRIMQYYVANFLQPPVHMALSRLFPNLPVHLEHFGLGPTLAVMRLKFRYGGIYTEDPYTDMNVKEGVPLTFNISREATETLIRRSLKHSRPNVTFETGTVTGFIRDGDCLGGVTVRTETTETEERGDLVIDATGPTQLGFSKALNAVGFPVSPDLRVEYNPEMKYTTGVWTLPEHVRAKWPVPGGYEIGVILAMTPDAVAGESRAFYLVTMERNQMLITTGGWNGPRAAHSMAEVRAYVQSLDGQEHLPDWTWALFDLLEEHEEECTPFYADAKVGLLNWIRWQMAKDLPKNFVAIGDAIMKLNPVYGQGITKTCIDITTLDAVLRRIPSKLPLPNVSKLFFDREAPRVEGLWDGTRANDYGWPNTIPTEGEDLNHNAFMRTWGRDVIFLGREDPNIHAIWWSVNMMVAPGTDLFSPKIVVKMMRKKWLGW
ncbi:hypothetical protein FRC05_010494 [Tulasnella sp. 425]|nr:hypothetical protein FRC05_010494 [Tulasnella sp. 425]